MPIDIDELYKRWVEKIGEDKIVLKYPSLRGLHDWFLRETEAKGINPETVDFEALVDPTLRYSENKAILDQELRAPLTDREYEVMSKEITGMMEKEAREKYPEIFDSLTDRIAELEREADRKKRYQKLVKELRLELAETIRKLEQEKAKPPEVKAVKIRVLKDFREGIIDYKSGQVVETRDLEWALQRIEKGFAERFKPEVEVLPPAPEVPVPSEKEAKVKVKVEGQVEKGEYIARMMFDTFEAGFIGFRTTDRLDNWLRAGEEIVNWRENLRAAGFSPEEIEEELKTYPEPFRQGVDVRVFWIYPEDVSFDAVAQKYWNVFHTPYERAMLEIKTVEELKNIAQIKGLRVLETKEELINVILGIRPPPPVALPPPTKPPITPFTGLTKAEEDRIETRFWSMLAEKGITPAMAKGRNYYAMFKDRVETWKSELRDTERTEAVKQVLEKLLPALIEDIQGLEAARAVVVERPPPPPERPPERIVRVGIPEEEKPPVELPPEFVIYPVEKPKKPLSPAAFPRSPTSEERAVLWDWFRYEMSRLGIDPYRYRKVMEERMNIPYRTWEGMMKTFQEMVKDIEEGRPLALIPLLRIPMPWEEAKGLEKWRRDAIVHFTATKLYKDMEELIDALAEWGVYPRVTEEEVKEAIKDAYAKKDIWFTAVPKEYLEELTGEKFD